MTEPTGRDDRTATQRIIETLTDRYPRIGFQQVAYPAGAFLAIVPQREVLEVALAALLDSGELVQMGGSDLGLHPMVRIALLNRTVLRQWIDAAEREKEPQRSMIRDNVATELRQLVAWAATADLPDDLADRAAQLAGVLVTRKLEIAAMDVVGKHGGRPQQRLAALAALPPHSLAAADSIPEHLRSRVSTVSYRG